MQLRKEIEPQIEIAEQRYPKVLKLILEYTDYCDENGDEDNSEYEKLENKLNKITGKDMSEFDLWEWWEGDGAENLAFDISLPEPQTVDDITKEELTEIISRLKTYQQPDENDESFRALFYHRTLFGNDYYYNFLEQNFTTYDPQLFQRQKDKNGNYFEYNTEEIVEKLWNNGKYR